MCLQRGYCRALSRIPFRSYSGCEGGELRERMPLGSSPSNTPEGIEKDLDSEVE